MTKTASTPVLAAALLVTTMPSTSSAAETPAITYTAAEGCPSEAVFAAEVAAHLKTTGAGLKLAISVDVGETNGAAFARVTYVDAEGKTVTRELTAATCGEVTSAAALVTSLAIDELAREVLPAEAAPAATQAAPPPPPKQDPVIDEPPSRGSASAGAGASPHWELGAGAFAEGVLAPEPMLGGSAFVGLSRFPAWSVRAHVAVSTNLLVENGERAAEFQFIGGRIDACALPFVTTTRLALGPCAAAALGSVRSNGVETNRYYANSEHEVWGAAGPVLRAQAKFVELFLDAEIGPWFPIVGTREYVFQRADGEVSFHEVPVGAWFFAAHAALSL